MQEGTTSKSRRYWLESYNGFSAEQRFAATPIQNSAVREGRLKLPTTCSICGYSKPDDIRGSGYIFMHLEDYNKPLDIHPACKRCHATLHARFKSPLQWLRVVKENYREGAWFMLLSMDPASQWRPFLETYPRGLPLPD